MRIRNAFAVAVGAGLLIAAVPAVANAATGDFSYRYLSADDQWHEAHLADPASRDCITLPQAADENATAPADTPRNRTNATATVFAGVDCTGEWFTLKPLTGRAGERLKVRSVIFS